MQINLLNQGKRGCQPKNTKQKKKKTKTKKIANESAEFREERILNQPQYQNEKIANYQHNVEKRDC